MNPASIHGVLGVLYGLGLCHDAYYAPRKLSVLERLDVGGVQAFIVSTAPGRVLICPGTNQPVDWIINLRFWATAGTVEAGDSGCLYHGGFLRAARLVYAFAKGRGLVGVVGHSLGAALAAIVGSSLKLHTIAYASPRPLFMGKPSGAEFVLNICRRDDGVCALPPKVLGYRHLGPVRWFSPETRHRGEDHRVPAYRAAIVGGEKGTWHDLATA